MTRDFDQTIRGADPSLDIRVCVEHGAIFIYQGSVDSRLYEWDDLIMVESAQAGQFIAALQEARQILALPGRTLVTPPPKLIHLDTLGELIGAAEFQAQIERGGSSARPLFKVRKPGGAQWTAAFVDGTGLAIASHQTHRIFVIDCRTLVDLACEAGVEDRAGRIILPRGLRHDSASNP